MIAVFITEMVILFKHVIIIIIIIIISCVNDFVMKHAFNVDLYPFLDVIGNIVVKRCVEFGVVELS